MPPKKAKPALARNKGKTAATYRAEALKRLKDKYEEGGKTFDASNEIVISPVLKAADGGLPRIFEALRAYDNSDAKAFVSLYDSLSGKDQSYLTIEEIAYASGIGALRLAEVAQSAVILHGKMATSLRIWSNADKIVKKSIQLAKTSRGVADREWALKHINYIPLPKGAQINIATQVNNGERELGDTRPAVYLDPGERLRAIHEAVEQRRLPSPDPEPVNVIPEDTSDILNAEYE